MLYQLLCEVCGAMQRACLLCRHMPQHRHSLRYFMLCSYFVLNRNAQSVDVTVWNWGNVNFCCRVHPLLSQNISHTSWPLVTLLVIFVISSLLLSVSFYFVANCILEKRRKEKRMRGGGELWSTMISDFSGS